LNHKDVKKQVKKHRGRKADKKSLGSLPLVDTGNHGSQRQNQRTSEMKQTLTNAATRVKGGTVEGEWLMVSNVKGRMRTIL
jgi:Cu/Zn superoxide dismutase